MNEIIIKFPQPVTGIKLIASDEIREHYNSQGKNVPFQWVGCPYVEIAGIWYAVIPFEGITYPSLSMVINNDG